MRPRTCSARLGAAASPGAGCPAAGGRRAGSAGQRGVPGGRDRRRPGQRRRGRPRCWVSCRRRRVAHLTAELGRRPRRDDLRVAQPDARQRHQVLRPRRAQAARRDRGRRSRRGWTRAGSGRSAPMSAGSSPTTTRSRDYVEHLLSCTPNRLNGLRVVVDCGNGAASAASPAGAAPDGRARCSRSTPARTATTSTRAADRPTWTTSARPSSSTATTSGSPTTATPTAAWRSTPRATSSTATRSWRSSPSRCRRRASSPQDTVVATVMTNLGLQAGHAPTRGSPSVETGVGDRYVLEAMRADGFNLGGEQSGHVVLLDYATTGDGTLTALHLLARMADTGRSLADLASVMTKLPQVLINVRGVDRPAVGTSPGLAAARGRAEAELGETGRVLLRPSGTEPVVRVMVEAPTDAEAQVGGRGTWRTWSPREIPLALTAADAAALSAERAGAAQSADYPVAMCGIVGYAGHQQAVDVVVAGLQAAGVPGLRLGRGGGRGDGETSQVRKKAGKLANLEALLAPTRWPAATTGIGHTRWATHGGPTDVNAHPHVSSGGQRRRHPQRHHRELRRAERGARRARASSWPRETDTEVVAHLLESTLRAAPATSPRRCARCAGGSRGRFTLVAVQRRGARPSWWAPGATPRWSSASATGENFLASDVSAFIEHTREAIELGQDQVVELRADAVTVTDFDGDAGRGHPVHRRLGRRGRREGRLRPVHAQGDRRAAQGGRRHAAGPDRPGRPAAPGRGAPPGRRAARDRQDRHRRLRHRVPRRAGRQVRHRALDAASRARSSWPASSATATRS